MTASFDLVVRGDLVLPEGISRDSWVAVTDEKIVAIGQGEPPAAKALADHRGRYVFPGLVDGHMHTGSAVGFPGIEGATLSAAAGGVTTVCDMPYDIPKPITNATIFKEKVEAVHKLAHVDVALYATITKHDGVGEIAALADAGACSFKLSTYEYDPVRFPRIDHPTMIQAFAEIAKTGLMVGVHNEDEELVMQLTAQAKAEGKTDPIMHCRTRPPLAESMANLEIFEIGMETGAHAHLAHSSIARGFEQAAQYRAEGGLASGETCIQYLCMTEEDVVRLEGFGKCNPPFRTADEVERVWEALENGDIAYVSTDHAPWQREKKVNKGDIFAVGAGLTGMQTFAPLMFSLLVERGLPVEFMARYCAERPARFHGLYPKKGAIRLGCDGDFCVIEPGDFVFDEATIQDRPDARWSPWHGRAMKGRVAATILRGLPIFDGTTVSAKPGSGQFVPRQHRETYTGGEF
ncbi:amidohydrolase family protein [Acetobacteraceae bacterium H6797]|nr:amidohydrolase family protein [Acetobacteraceae bacterium H6797]